MYVAAVEIPSGIPPYTVHQYLYGYFPQHPPEAPRPFLFRQAGSRCLLVSRIRPACPHAEISLAPGRTYPVEALLVPTLKRRGADGKLFDVPMTGNRPRREWFVELCRRFGGHVGFCQWHDRPRVQFRHGAGHPITLQPAQVKAMIAIADPVSFGETVLRGMGRGKAFGYGLLVFPELMFGEQAVRMAG